MDSFREKLAKLAAKKEDEQDESHTGRNLAMGAAAAAPFAGLIGQQPIKHDPILNRNIPRVKSMRDLSRVAQPGDVLMTSKPSNSIWKSFIKPLSGSEFYHSQPVVGKRHGKATTISAGEHDDPSWKNWSDKDRLKSTTSVSNFGEEYPDVMVMRPKKPLAPDELKRFVDSNMQRSKAPYDSQKALGTWLKETFVPKIKGLENSPMPGTCKGNVCSTMPAMAYADAGRTVIPGKAPQDIFPPDFLRSDEFEPVAARIKNPYLASPLARKVMPYAARAGLGLGLAGGVYGLSKDPALAAIPAGMIAGGSAASALSRHFTGRGSPSLSGFLGDLPDARGATRQGLIRGFTRKTLPGMLAGGALSYLGGRGLEHLLKEKHDGDDVPPV